MPTWIRRMSLGLMVGVAASPTIAATFYVAPNGHDQWSGRLVEPNPGRTDGPFATLTRAQAAIRQLKAAGQLEAGATVFVRGGTYELTETFTLGPEDSGTAEGPVVYRAFGNEKPVLVGARKITGFRPWKGDILQCDLKGTAWEGVAFRQLFFRGERMVLARYPNKDPEDVHGGTWAHVLSADQNRPDRFLCTEDVIKDWTRVEQAEVCIHPTYGWAWMVVPIQSVDRESGEIILARSTHYGQTVGDRFYVQNLLEELDAPGEWYLDRDQAMLYFWPPADLREGEVLAPVTNTVVAMKGASHVTVRGFTLEACDGDAVQIQDGESCLVAQSVIRNCGGWGVSIAGGHRSGAMGNDIYATGCGGVSLNGGDRKTLERGDNFATNNYIHHIAEFQKTYHTGVNINGVGNTASHNLIHDCYHQGILLGGNDNVVEYNVVHHTNLGSEDTGGLYMSSRDYTARGNVIRYNIFHHLGGFGKANSWAPVQDGRVKFEYPHFTWGIYLDAPETGVTVYGNVLYSVPICGMFNHSGKDNTWENNIVVDAPGFRASVWDSQDLFETSWKPLREARQQNWPGLQRYPELARYDENEPRFNTMFNCRFVRNIIYYTPDGGKWLRERNRNAWQGGQLLWTYVGHQDDFLEFEFDYNTVYAPEGIDLKIELTRTPEPGRLLSWEEWRATGQDAHSIFADPMFVDPENHDYRLKPESPALKLGFKPIPFEQIGPYEDELRASWPIVEAPGASALGDFTTERYFQLPGYEPVPAQEFVPRRGAGNFFAKLAAGKPVTVACFAGGNHAQGGWLPGVTQWLRERYPNVEITDVDASICGCVRGSPFSVYRFEHDVLKKKPDLVWVDFASDDTEFQPEAIWAAIEGVVRQAWTADPNLDLIFVYAFRPGFEAAYAENLSPGTVSAYEKLAAHYGIPAINPGYRIAQMARAGKVVIQATPEEAERLQDRVIFTTDGVYTSPAANHLYAQIIAENLAKLAAGRREQPHEWPPPFRRQNLEQARLAPITAEMLTGEWEKLSPDHIDGRNFARHFDDVWFTRTPGAKLTFKFRGTEASLFNLMGPDTGRAKVTVDGQEMGIREQVDRWAYYQRLSALPLASGLEDTEHTVTVELLPDPPDRRVPIEEAKRVNQYEAADFEGVAFRFGWIRMVGRSRGRMNEEGGQDERDE